MSEPEGDPGAARVRRYRRRGSRAAVRAALRELGRACTTATPGHRKLGRADARPRSEARGEHRQRRRGLGGRARRARSRARWRPCPTTSGRRGRTRFLRVTLRSVPPWRWPGALWLYRASGRDGAGARRGTASTSTRWPPRPALPPPRRGAALLDEAERRGARRGAARPWRSTPGSTTGRRARST